MKKRIVGIYFRRFFDTLYADGPFGWYTTVLHGAITRTVL